MRACLRMLSYVIINLFLAIIVIRFKKKPSFMYMF